jgi:phage tail tape-measure protein
MASKYTIAELLVEIGMDASEAEKSAKRISAKLDKVKKSADGVKGSTMGAKETLRGLNKEFNLVGRAATAAKAAMVGVVGIVGGLGKAVISTGSSFEKLRAQLKTATGSAQGAEEALGFVRDFAKNTPFQVTEITEAFVKLTNLGLEPSERALTSYGNTASAMGKSLDQFIEAVADATTGEFERLKEFGIKSRSEGDRVAFTFRGITTEVGKNSAEIEEFLTSLGENNFAGAMAAQMETLGGITSNLQDAFTDFLLAVAESGPLEEFKGLIADLRDVSGDKEGLAKTLGRVLTQAIRTLRRVLTGDLVGVLKTAAEALAFVVENFDKLVFLFGAAKTFQAFQSVAQGFNAMGLAASGALGPIGAIASALIALIPIAIDAGDKIGDVLSKGRTGTPKAERGVKQTLGQEFGSQSAKAGALTRDINRENSLLLRLDAEGRGDSFSAKEARRRLQKAESGLSTLRKQAEGERAAARAAADAEAQRQAALEKADAAEAAEFGSFDRDVASISEALGIEGSPTGRQQARLDKAIVALSEGKSVKDARRAAGLDRRGGGRRRKKKEKAPVTSPTTVSEFFGAAARGELGDIAARTPSTGEIEPTVAVDITNNNFTFSDTFNIKGVNDPVEAGKEVIKQVKAEFDRRLSSAGQQLATNVVR